MKPKQIAKLCVDAAMTLGLLLLMGYHLWGDVLHEWLGAGMFALFILHHVLNGRWWTGVFCGRYTAARTLQTAVDLLTLAAMLGLMVSGVMLSGHVFAFLRIRGHMVFARRLHLAASHWGFVLMSAHLGLHWGAMLAFFKKGLHLKKSLAPLPAVLGALAAAYGVFAFCRRDFVTSLFLRAEFVFLDYSEFKLLFYLDYIAIMAAFVFVTHDVAKLLRKRSGGRPQ